MTKLMRKDAIASQRETVRQVLLSGLNAQGPRFRDYIAVEIANISLGGLYRLSIARASELLLSLTEASTSQARSSSYGGPTWSVTPLHSLAQKVKTSCFGICLVCLREGKEKPELCVKHAI